MIDNNGTNMFSKVSSFIKSYIFDKLALYNVTCYSAYKHDNLIFNGEPVRKHKNTSTLSWAQFLWQFNDGKEDVVPGLCLLLIDLQNVMFQTEVINI